MQKKKLKKKKTQKRQQRAKKRATIAKKKQAAVKRPAKRVRAVRAKAAAKQMPAFSFLNSDLFNSATVAFDFSERAATKSFPVLATEQSVVVSEVAETRPVVTASAPTRIPVSKHVIDLRNLTAQRERERSAALMASQPISERVFSSLMEHQERFKEKTAARAQAAVRISLPLAKSAAQLASKIPQISVPKLSLPAVHLPKITLPNWSLPTLALPVNWKESLAIFAVFALLFTLPFQGITYIGSLAGTKGNVLGATTDAISHLKSSAGALSARDVYGFTQQLGQASQDFGNAQRIFGEATEAVSVLARITPGVGTQFSAAQDLLELGTTLTGAANSVAGAFSAAYGAADQKPTERIATVLSAVRSAQPSLERAAVLASRIDIDAVPTEYRDTVQRVVTAVPQLKETAASISEAGTFLLNLLGNEQSKRYLLLFQNNNELRPTGGFIGSFALVDIDRGALTRADVPAGGSYDLQGTLSEWVASPKQLRVIEDRWQFHDANWFPNFPTSAQKVLWFYEHSGGPSVDGVIAINASTFADLLTVIGPIELPDYGKTITADNFYDEVQRAVELDYDVKENKPKRIIGDLMTAVLDRLTHMDGTTAPKLLAVLADNLARRSVQMYFADPVAQQYAHAHDWTGEQQQVSGDYLQLVTTNIAGGKTDAITDQEVLLETTIADDGTVTNTLTITKRHHGDPTLPFYNVPNVDYLRIYVPQGSTLVSASGFNPPDESVFALKDNAELLQEDPELRATREHTTVDTATGTELYQENGKTVFANWIQTGVGQEHSARISYILPFKVKPVAHTNMVTDVMSALSGENQPAVATYSLYVQAQSGKRPFPLLRSLTLPADARTIWQYPPAADGSELSTDQFYGLLFTR